MRRDVEPLVVVDLFFRPLFYRKLLRRQRVTPAFAAHVFRSAMTPQGKSTALSCAAVARMGPERRSTPADSG